MATVFTNDYVYQNISALRSLLYPFSVYSSIVWNSFYIVEAYNSLYVCDTQLPSTLLLVVCHLKKYIYGHKPINGNRVIPLLILQALI